METLNEGLGDMRLHAQCCRRRGAAHEPFAGLDVAHRHRSPALPLVATWELAVRLVVQLRVAKFAAIPEDPNDSKSRSLCQLIRRPAVLPIFGR